MIKRDEIANPNSCLNKAADDEPLFVFRANDPLAPELVRFWAEQYFDSKKDHNFNVTAQQREKYREAKRLADAMQLPYAAFFTSGAP